MTIAMFFFFISFLGIIFMIWFKSYELKVGKRLILAHLAQKTDLKIHLAYQATRTYLSYFNRKSAVALVQWMAYHILSWARSFYILIHRKAHAHPPSKKVIDMVRGRGQVERGGGASFYLKRIGSE